MKKYILSLLTISSCLAANAKDVVKIHGQIKNPLSDSVQIMYAFTSIAYKPIILSLRLGKDGSFKSEFEVKDKFTSVTITNGDQQTELMVLPGYDLALKLDGKNFDSSLHYEGKGKEVANYMAKCVLENHTSRAYHTQAQMLCAKDIEEYKTALKDLQKKELAFLAANGKNLPEAIKEYYRLTIMYNTYSTMDMYPRVHEMFKQKSNSIKEVPVENYAIIKDIPEAFNDAYLPISAYTQYLNNFYSLHLSRELAINKNADWNFSDSEQALSYRHMPPKSAEYHVGQQILYSIKNSPPEKLDRQFTVYKTHFTKSKNIAILEDAIALKTKMGPGKNAIDFDITTPEGKKMRLSDLRGKIVYIDFWSRSCAPCIGEMPDAKKVRDHFVDKPVAFVYVSLDKDVSVWEKAIKDFEVNGINTHLDKDFQSELAKQYGVAGIPSYFLIDKEGKFADVKYVERPGSPEKLIAQIETLLK